jgi:hypothetical protein
MIGRNLLAAGIAAGLLAGCTGLPSFSAPFGRAARGPDPAAQGVPTVSDVVIHVQCEILALFRDGHATAYDRLSRAPGYPGYVVSVDLLLEVKNDGGINPSLSFIHPFATSGTDRTLGFGAGYDSAAHRTYHQTFTLVLDPRTVSMNDERCNAPAESHGIRGELGIAQVVAEGLRHSARENFIFPPGGEDPPAFGSTIDFTAVLGLNADPVWTLTHFTGPGGGGSSFLGFTRTHTETLTLSFAPLPPSTMQGSEISTEGSQAPSQAAIDAAVRAARDNVTRMILQHILPRR